MRKERGPKYLMLCALWMYSLCFSTIPAVLLFETVSNKTFLMWFCGIVYSINIFTGLYFVMGFGERDAHE